MNKTVNSLLIFVLLISLILVSLSLRAEVKRLSPTEGLSQSYVNTLMIDKKGYLWLATEGGLNRYDGYQVHHLSGPNGELDEAIIDRIYQDPAGNIWIASLLAGVFRYDPQNDTYQQFLSKPATEAEIFQWSVFSMLAVDDKTLWLGRGSDFAKLDVSTGKIETVFKLPNRKKNTVIRQLFHYQGYIFIGTSDGGFVYNIASNQYRTFEHLDGEASHIYQNNIKSFALAANNNLLVGTVKGLYEVDISNINELFNAKDQAFNNKQLLEELNVWEIINEQQVLTLGTDKGLFNYDLASAELTKDERISNSKYTLSDTSIIDIIKDSSGGLWVGTKSDGAFYLPHDNYHFMNIDAGNLKGDGLSHSSIWGITELENQLWLATHNGLTAIDLTSLESKIYLKNHLVDLTTTEFSIYKIMPYKGKLWLHTNRGLFLFNPETAEITEPPLANSQQRMLIEDWIYGITLMPDGTLYYVHPDQGMFVYDINNQEVAQLHGEFDNFDPFLAYGFLPPLTTKPNSPLFYNAGILYQIDPTDFSLNKIYAVPKQHENVAVNVMSYIVDNNNVLWLSLSNFGLIGLDATTYEHIHTIDLDKHKLGTLLYDMVLDERGMIWMSSHKGVWRFNPENKHFQQFTSAEGLVSTEFNSGAFTRLKSGEIVYGSLKGFTYFYPLDNYPSHGLIDRVNITSVDLMSRDLNAHLKQSIDSITLAHDDIGLDVAFSAMAFNYQERIVYEYQLADGQKSYTRNTNRVLFPKLNPGTYQLKVWAKDPLTGSYTPPANLDIIVEYPQWRSPYFIALYLVIIFVVIAGWMMRRNRIQQILLVAHKESQESEARLKLALEGSHSGMWDWQSSNPIIYQPRLKSELGYESDSVNLDDYLAKIHPQDKQHFRLEWLEFLSTDKGYFNCTYRLRHADGEWRWYKDFGKVVEWQQSTPLKVAGTYTNMTRELVFAEHARLFGAAFEQTRDWVFILDKNLRILATNNALQQAFEYPQEFTSSLSLTLGLSISSRIHYLRVMQNLPVSEHFSVEDTVQLANGEKRQVLIKISAVAGSNKQLESYVIILTDISAQKAAEQELQLLVNYDALTGLPRRTLFNDRLKHALEQASRCKRKVALLTINIKRFKHFNDSFGHEVADQIIKSAAARIQNCLRPQDSAARFDADGFKVLIEDIKQIEEILLLCAKLMDDSGQAIVINEQNLSVYLSIGAAIYPDDAKQSKELIKAADIALYHAKQSAEQCYQFYHKEMNQQVQRTLHLESQITQAYQEHAFCNYYQPIVSSKTAEVEGLEVLLRWPDNNQYQTQELALAAEGMGLITKIMLQTFSRALIELKQWHKIQPDLYVSINLSALDFEYNDLVPELKSILLNAQIPPQAVVFEITESVMMHDSKHALKSMLKIKSLGCRLYMDDFGTGYASLTYLKRFPIDVLKIDRSFVTDIGVDSDDEVIIQSTLALAKSLDLECVAEGVEDINQVRFLSALGCSRYQGYLFSKPVPGDEVSPLLTKQWTDIFFNVA